MTARSARTPREPKNHIAEWFGHRTFPIVAATPQALSDQRARRCPFLTDVTGSERTCVKAENSQGVCTVSSHGRSSGRQDWLVCPIRALDLNLLEDVARRLFDVAVDEEIDLVAAPTLMDPARRADFVSSALRGRPTIAYFQTKLGGEITLTRTERSPEFSFDATLVELLPDSDGRLRVGRYGIFEIQTMDYHGSYSAAVSNLRDGLRLHKEEFHDALAKRPDWAGERMEGPNIANVFKRTFYQMLFKFQVGAHPTSAGCVFAIPRPVWDSWQPHLASPELVERGDGAWQLAESTREVTEGRPPAWIYVTDLDPSAETSPNELKIWRRIAVDAASISHYALDLAPEAALEEGGSVDRLLASIKTRLAVFLPGLLV